MQYQEFGADRADTILLLHGGGLSWWNYRREAQLLREEYRVILPILDGHAGSDRHFTTIRQNAAEIIDFIDRHLGGSVLLIGGLSLGAQILLEMLAQRGDICRYALVESAAVIPSRLTGALIGPALGSSYGLIRNERFARLQFRSLHMDEALFEDYYRDTCRIEKRDMAAFLKASTTYSLKDAVADSSARICVFAGGKENRQILDSVKAIRKAVPSCRTHIVDGLYHGEFSINHPEAYVGWIRRIVHGRPQAF